jgi:hypothetical protein
MRYLLFFLVFIPFLVASQDTIKWNFEWKTDSLSNPVWNVDPFGNLIVSEKDKLKKFDSLGTQKFVQSNKYFGAISSVDPSNPMKTLVFSEQQQLIGYVDNTLSKQQENIELSAFDLSYVTMVSTSGQPDKFWVYDQDNSVIVLISKNVQQRQRIENISGLLGCKDIVQLFETENNLYLIDKQRGIYQFDIYGTLVFHWENVGILCAEVEGKFAYLLKSDKLQVINLSNQEIVNFPLPVGEFSIFKKVQNHFYFGTNSNIQRYSIEFLH